MRGRIHYLEKELKKKKEDLENEKSDKARVYEAKWQLEKEVDEMNKQREQLDEQSRQAVHDREQAQGYRTRIQDLNQQIPFRQGFKRYIGRHLYESEIDRMMLQLGFRVLPATYHQQGKRVTVRQYRDNESCVYASFSPQKPPRNLGYLDKNRSRISAQES